MGSQSESHLKAKGIAVCVFGEPMEFWANKMPEGMLLRSPRVASNLSDPDRAFTLEAYEAASKKAPLAPLPLDTFVEYGRWFRHQLGSDLDQRNVLRIDRDQPGVQAYPPRRSRDSLEVCCSGRRNRSVQEKATCIPEPLIPTGDALL